ncbi:MAG: M23 family peptidase, partial [Muribaculaceae bacterium]|nr:M23 family peptidase [Muribaculaceae bacterium]
MKNVYYKYNPETDNYERIYPTLKDRLSDFARVALLALVIAAAAVAVVFLCYDTPTEQTLRAENRQLKTQYNILSRRLQNSIKVMGNIQNRDDNF